MSQAGKLFGANLSLNTAGNVTVAAATTVTNTAAINLYVKGQALQLALGAKTPRAYADETGTTLSAADLAAASLATGEGCIVVWATDGTNVKGIFGPKVKVDAAGNPTPGLAFPSIPDHLTAYAFYTVKATGAVTFGTTNFSGGNATTTAFSVAVLPNKSLSSFTAI